MRALRVRLAAAALGLVVAIVVCTDLTAQPAGPTQVEKDLTKAGVGFAHHAKKKNVIIAAAVPHTFTSDDFGALVPNLRKLPELETLDLADSARLDDAVLAHIAKLPRVHAVYLDRTKVTGRGLAALKPMPDLNLLCLSGCALTDLDGFDALPGLKSVDVSHTQILDAGLTKVLAVRLLYRLDASGNRVSCANMTELGTMRNLREAMFVDTMVGEAGINTLLKLATLERLDVSRGGAGYLTIAGAGNANVNNRGGTDLSNLWALRDGKSIYYPTYTDVGDFMTAVRAWAPNIGIILPPGELERIAEDARQSKNALLNNVRGSDLGYMLGRRWGGPQQKSLITLKSFDETQHWLSMRSLSLRGSSVEDPVLKKLVLLPQLDHLDLTNTPVTGNGVTEFAEAKKLKSLWLASSKFSDDGVANVLKAPALEDLQLAGTLVTFVDVPDLAKVKKVKALNLSGTKVTDAGLQNLSAMPALEDLDLAGTDVTCERLALSRFRGLKRLNLNWTKTNDVGLKSVTGIKSLRLLCLRGSEVTEKGVRAFMQEQPGCLVIWDWPTPPPPKGVAAPAPLPGAPTVKNPPRVNNDPPTAPLAPLPKVVPPPVIPGAPRQGLPPVPKTGTGSGSKG